MEVETICMIRRQIINIKEQFKAAGSGSLGSKGAAGQKKSQCILQYGAGTNTTSPGSQME